MPDNSILLIKNRNNIPFKKVMKLLYPEEHIHCLNYSKNNGPAIENIELSQNEDWEVLSAHNKILFLLSGKLSFSFNEYKNKIIPEKKVMTMPSNTNIKIKAFEDSHFVIFRLQTKVQLCDTYSLDKLLLDNNNKSPNINFLDIDERLFGYLSLLNTYVSDGLKCIYFFQIKVQELFFLLRAYYPKNELIGFFKPLMDNNTTFSDFVFENYKKVKSVKELAEMANYSLSGFQKHFKKVFGVSAYQWINDQRSKSVYHELNNSEKPLKEISDNYGFSSPSHFNDFCKSQFGETPGEIRRKR